MHRALCLLPVLMIAACAERKPPMVTMTNPITAEQVALYKEGGTGRISGQAFLRKDSGGVVTCAGSEVFLMPDTVSTREVVERMRDGKVADMRIGGERPSKLFPHAFKKRWCDRYGSFRFDQLADGAWIIMTAVHWRANYQEHGSVIVGYVDVEKDAAQDIVLTEAHRI